MLSLPINQQLTNLQNWQQRVFCMALSEQSRLHFHLFCEAIESNNTQKIDLYNQLFWDKMINKGSKVNFAIQQEAFDEIIPNAADFDFYGVYPAIDHCVILSCTFNSFINKSSEEALNASQTAFSTIASFIELQQSELSEIQLKETMLFQTQLAFQKELLIKLDNLRSPELIKSIRQFVIEQGSTNLGIAYN
ncbi:YjaG family protein [Psychromonas sp. CD1]|uniref:YjaG family protein n=1 Tax=Psychromonas sp. CD1 TaxID=1979839 RepID=UPI000B9C1C75|nr:YjaG family protein [Psychromonas sp. CD1]